MKCRAIESPNEAFSLEENAGFVIRGAVRTLSNPTQLV